MILIPDLARLRSKPGPLQSLDTEHGGVAGRPHLGRLAAGQTWGQAGALQSLQAWVHNEY